MIKNTYEETMLNVTNKDIGTHINNLRKKYGISLKKLSRGLCSTATLFRIEGGWQDTEYLLIQLLMERLGKSMDRYTYILSDRDYKLYTKRDEILSAVKSGDMKLCRHRMKEYMNNPGVENPLHRQFLDYINIEIAIKEGCNRETIIRLIESAIIHTCEYYKEEDLARLLFSSTEFMLLYKLYSEKGKLGYDVEIIKQLYGLLYYMDSHQIDFTETAKTYSDIACNIVRLLRENSCIKSFMEGISVCNRAMEAIEESSVIIYKANILYEKAECMEMIINSKRDNDSIEGESILEYSTLKYKKLLLQLYYVFDYLEDERAEDIKLKLNLIL